MSVIRTATDLSDDTQAKFNYSAAGGSAGDNHDHSRLDSPDGLIVPVVQAANSGFFGIATTAPNFQAEVAGHLRITEDNRLKLDGTGTADVSMDLWGSTVSAGATNYLELQTPFVDGRTVLRMVPKGTPASVPTALEFYGTDFHADGTNWERLSIRSGSTYQIFTENNGTGTLRPLQLTTSSNTGLNIDTSGKVGIGTTAIPHGANGIAMLALDGANASTAGPHIQTTTALDDFPVLQIASWAHDNVILGFDMYFDGTNFRSGDATSNFQLYKVADQLRMYYSGPHAQGAVVSRAIGFVLDTSGRIGLGGITSPSARLDIGGGDVEFTEMTAPGAGAVNTARLYAVDNGAGKTQLAVVFNTGAVQILATQP